MRSPFLISDKWKVPKSFFYCSTWPYACFLGFTCLTCEIGLNWNTESFHETFRILSLFECAIKWFWMGEIKISVCFKLISVRKAQKRVRSSLKKGDKYVTHIQIVCSYSNPLIVLNLALPPWCHESRDILRWCRHVRSSFLLKTLSHCNSSCPIWNQLNSIQDLDQLLKLVHSHKALSCSNKYWQHCANLITKHPNRNLSMTQLIKYQNWLHWEHSYFFDTNICLFQKMTHSQR